MSNQIDSIKVRGFELLSDVELKFGRLTTIRGASNSGKSCLFRALFKLMFNHKEAVHKTHGRKVARVELSMQDGNSISWQHDGGIEYQVNKVKLPKGGNTVPDEVLDILPIKEIKIVDERLSPNFGKQTDHGVFLINISSSNKLGQFFSEIFKVDAIYNVINLLSKDVKSDNREVKLLKEQLDSKNIIASRLSEVEVFAESVIDLEKMLNEYNGYEDVLFLLEDLIVISDLLEENIPDVGSIEPYNKQINLYKSFIEVGDVVNVVDGLSGVGDNLVLVSEHETPINLFNQFIKIESVLVQDVPDLSAMAGGDERLELLNTFIEGDEMENSLNLELSDIKKSLKKFKICPIIGDVWCKKAKELLK